MHRELGDERARYGRRTRREEIEGLVDWARAHPVAITVLLLVVGLMAWSLWPKPSARLGDLAVGDCLFVPTAAAQDPVSMRPIGDVLDVGATLVAGGAQQADCAASHGHEVAAIVTAPVPSIVPAASVAPPTEADIRRLAQPLCDAAFAGYVGRPLAGSRYTTFPIVPLPDPAWLAGERRTVCLVARLDGQWMDHAARGSAE